MNSLELLQAYFKGEKYEFKGDVQEEIALQNKQSLAPFLYYVYGEPFFNVYLGCALIQEKFFALQREITKLFNENKIKHYFIKGSVLADLYPDPVLRTRGDIDVVVQECDYERAKNILISNGYAFTGKCDKDVEIRKDNLLVELHKYLLDSSYNLHNYFGNGFKHAKLKKEYEYELNNEFHYIYLIYHLNKHISDGEGLRSLLDFYYLHYSFDLNYTYIEDELNKINLFKLYQTICNCLFIITNKKLPGYNASDVTKLLNYMLINGVHGYNDEKHLYEKQMTFKNEGKIKFLFKKVFINKSTRKIFYPKLSKCCLCYPIIIAHRFFYLILNKRKELNKLIKSDNSRVFLNKDDYDNYGIIRND